MKPGEKSREERLVRYDLMDNYVRTSLLPYDFSLTADQESELFSAVRNAMEDTSDEELFSAILRFKVDEVVDAKIRPWRAESQSQEKLGRLKEIRASAADYVSTFLNVQASPAALEEIKGRLGIQDSVELETELRNQVSAWIGTLDDNELLQYDVVTVKDLVFARLRSEC